MRFVTITKLGIGVNVALVQMPSNSACTGRYRCEREAPLVMRGRSLYIRAADGRS